MAELHAPTEGEAAHGAQERAEVRRAPVRGRSGMSEKERGMSDIRERMAEVLWEKFGAEPTAPLAAWLDHQDCVRFADAILAEFDVTPRGEDRWEYGVKWGDEPDDSRPALCDSREHAESRAAESHGDKIVRRTPARTIPAGEWEEMPDE